MKIPSSNEEPLNFTIATLQLKSSFYTETSISFDVKAGPVQGWIDVHHPCRGHIKLQIRGLLPEEYLEVSKVKEIVSAIRIELEIPSDETFEAVFFKPTKSVRMSASSNSEGMTDRIETKRLFDLPPRSERE